MVFNFFCVHVLWTKVVSALKGLKNLGLVPRTTQGLAYMCVYGVTMSLGDSSVCWGWGCLCWSRGGCGVEKRVSHLSVLAPSSLTLPVPKLLSS